VVHAKKAFALCLIVSLIAISHVYAYPSSSSDAEVDQALLWLRSRQDPNGAIGSVAVSSWAVIAIMASEEDPNDWTNGGVSIVQYLESNVGTLSSSNDYSRFILSMVAAGEDPTDINNIDLVATLESFHDGSQFDDPSLLNDDYWAVMAIISAGISEDDPKIQNTVTFIKTNQNPTDHGWSWGIGADSDVDSTAAAIMALIAAGEPETSTCIINALSYMKSKQTNSGGFDSWGFGTSVETDAWAIQAIIAAGQDPTSIPWIESDNTPLDDLLSFQNPDGSFSWITGQEGGAWITSNTIPALLGKKYPITSTEMTEQVYVRIEDVDETVWRGWIDIPDSVTIQAYNSTQTYQIEGNNVLSILHRASELGGFTYQISDQWYPDVGFYIESISDHSAQGLYGWLYLVNYASGNVAMNKYNIQATDNVLIYWGTQGVRPLKIEADRTEVAINEPFTITVKYLNNTDGDWIPVEGGTIHVNDDYITDSEGKALITLTESKVYDIYAEKWGSTAEEQFIRSDLIKIGVGVPIPEFNAAIQFLIGMIIALSLILTKRRAS